MHTDVFERLGLWAQFGAYGQTSLPGSRHQNAAIGDINAENFLHDVLVYLKRGSLGAMGLRYIKFGRFRGDRGDRDDGGTQDREHKGRNFHAHESSGAVSRTL